MEQVTKGLPSMPRRIPVKVGDVLNYGSVIKYEFSHTVTDEFIPCDILSPEHYILAIERIIKYLEDQIQAVKKGDYDVFDEVSIGD